MAALEPVAARSYAGDQAPGQLAGRLGAARAAGFVGRTAELTALAQALDGSTDVRLIFVHGPGGIGKTTLLDAMDRLVERAGRGTIHLDARGLECSPAAVRTAIEERSRTSDPAATWLVDGYELLSPLDRWFRTELLPTRPAQAVTVLAGRDAPAPDWWLDPGWRRLIAVHALAALDQTESRHLLSSLGVTDQIERLARLGRGYPLALAMLAEVDRSGRRPDQLADAPDAVGQLCSLILDDVPDEAHRTGLATCAHATRTTQDLLTHMVGQQATAEVWSWLETRPYVQRGPLGLFVHDVVRELFEAELAHRSPTEYTQLHRAIRSFFLDRIADPAEPHPDRAAAEVLLLHRRTPLAAETSILRDRGQLSVPRAGAAEREQIIGLIEANEGPESADLARRWLAAQPRSAYHVRADTGTAAFAIQVYLPGPPDLMTDDPIAVAVWQHVSDRGLRPGERVNLNRFAGATTRYQGDPLQLLVNGVSCILEWRTTPAAWTFISSFGGTHYGAYFDYLGLAPMLEVTLGGQPIIQFGWDRRRFPSSAFFEMMATRELTGETGPPPPALMRPAPLARTDFDVAVRAALRRLSRTGGLAGSALLTTALVPAGSDDPEAALASVLRETIAGLDGERGGAEHRRVLERTFVTGAPSQEAAAEILDLPFSTYRRHLARAVDRLVEVLWAMELGGSPAEPRSRGAATE